MFLLKKGLAGIKPTSLHAYPSSFSTSRVPGCHPL